MHYNGEVTNEQEVSASLARALVIPYEKVYAVNDDTAFPGDYQQEMTRYIEQEVFEEDRPLFDNLRTADGIKKLLAGRDSYDFQYRILRGGSVVYYKCQLLQAEPDTGKFVVGLKNINEDKQRDIIEGISGEYYSVLLVYPGADAVTTYRAKDEDGRNISDFFERHHNCWSKGIQSYANELLVEGDREEFLEKLSLDYIREHRESYALTYEKIIDDETTIFLQVRVSCVRGKSGSLVVVIGTRNIDDIVRHEREREQVLREAFEAAEAANRAKTEFLSNISHDMRTPMNGIIGMTAIAATNIDDTERVKDCLQKITQASKHLLSLVNEVLDMSKIESGKVHLYEEEFKLSDLIDNLLSMTKPQMEAHRHSLRVNISDVVHEAVIGDSLRIQKIFTNLMSNAVKFTPDGGDIRISITEKPCNQAKVGCYEFVFEDNGIGMSEEFKEQIFEPFSRAEDKRVNRIQGTGLGMPISRNLVRMMGGDIQVESRLGEGSRFIVTIYLKLQETTEIRNEKFIDLDVLVADEDDLSREYCCAMLSDLGMKAEGVDTGQKAIDRIVQHHDQKRDYFACILDWKMPDMDGIAATRAIRRAVGEHVPIIIISAYDWSEIEQEARAAGANAFIAKPLFRSRLATTFNRLLGEKEEVTPVVPLEELEHMDFSAYRVLLVEDNELNAEIAAEFLKRTGLNVETAEDGSEAVERVGASADGYFDLIFMDIMMPKMNGYDAARAIRSMNREYCRRVPIIAMTANAFAEDVQAAKTVGMNGHIAKPLEVRALIATLEKWLK